MQTMLTFGANERAVVLCDEFNIFLSSKLNA